MAGKLSLISRFGSWIKGGGKRFSKIPKPDLKSMSITQKLGNGTTVVKNFGGTVANAGAKAGRKIISWGGALKASIVAGGGVVAYYLLQGGLVDLISNALNVDETTSQIIIVIVGVILLLFIANWILGKFGGKRSSTSVQSYPRSYNNYNRNYKGGRKK